MFRCFNSKTSTCRMWRSTVIASAAALSIFSVGAITPAHDFTPYMWRPSAQRKHFQGDLLERAGHPERVSPLAAPSRSPREEGYFVGGGAREKSNGSQERQSGEGTWGTDYTGVILPKKTNLRWWHGQRYQGGVGSYRIDGPRIIHKP